MPRMAKIHTHTELIDPAADWLRLNHQMTVLTEPRAKRVGLQMGEIPDVYGYRIADVTAVIEIKVSIADFNADIKKEHRTRPGMGSYRWYCCPNLLIETSLIPWGWGLLYVADDGGISEVMEPQRVWTRHRNLRDELELMGALARWYERDTGKAANDVKPSRSKHISKRYQREIAAVVGDAIGGICKAGFVLQQLPTLGMSHGSLLQKAERGEIPGVGVSRPDGPHGARWLVVADGGAVA